jgi:hypothetical protein
VRFPLQQSAERLTNNQLIIHQHYTNLLPHGRSPLSPRSAISPLLRGSQSKDWALTLPHQWPFFRQEIPPFSTLTAAKMPSGATFAQRVVHVAALENGSTAFLWGRSLTPKITTGPAHPRTLRLLFLALPVAPDLTAPALSMG